MFHPLPSPLQKKSRTQIPNFKPSFSPLPQKKKNKPLRTSDIITLEYLLLPPSGDIRQGSGFNPMVIENITQSKNWVSTYFSFVFVTNDMGDILWGNLRGVSVVIK